MMQIQEGVLKQARELVKRMTPAQLVEYQERAHYAAKTMRRRFQSDLAIIDEIKANGYDADTSLSLAVSDAVVNLGWLVFEAVLHESDTVYEQREEVEHGGA